MTKVFEIWEGCNKKRDELEKEYELIEEERKSISLQREALNHREDMQWLYRYNLVSLSEHLKRKH